MMNPAEFANIAQAEQDFWWYRGMREILYRVLDPLARVRRFERVAEAGCGTGYLSQVLAKRYGWTIYPLDIGDAGLAFARQRGVRRLVQGDAAALPFRSEAFELLLSIDVIAHLERGREDAALAESFRALAPGGVLILRTSALDFLRSRHSAFAGEEQRFTKRRLTETIERAGFRIERITFVNSLLLPVALLKFRVWEPLTRQAVASGIRPTAPWLDRMLFRPLRVEADWIARGRNLPAGQSLLVVASKPW
jgi:ubiquinone/menaquinone biosynthesis C-methylase UbiE